VSDEAIEAKPTIPEDVKYHTRFVAVWDTPGGREIGSVLYRTFGEAESVLPDGVAMIELTVTDVARWTRL
jgi:hypothetical protein